MDHQLPALTRRTFLHDTAAGMGLAALASMLHASSAPLRGAARQDDDAWTISIMTSLHELVFP